MSYPPYTPQDNLHDYPPSESTYNFDPTKPHNPERISRTPSPTPSEQKELSSAGPFNWKELIKPKFWLRREWLWYYVAFVLIFIIAALVSIYHTQIVNALKPAANWIHSKPYGFAIPIVILFVISFPPLFGHEIVAILCGLVWGLWIGFAIVAAGTFVGEVGNFYAFKYCCRARGEKLEREKIVYGCLAKVVRDGGFKIALIARLSAIPGHFTTAVFSTCGMGIVVFSIAAILSLPKQFITVYIGVILEGNQTGKKDPKSQLISDIVLAVTFLITVLAMWYIYHQMGKVKVEVIYQRRKARQAKLTRAGFSTYGNHGALDSTVGLNPGDSDTDIPLKPPHGPSTYNVDGYSRDPRLYAPQPTRGHPYGHAYKADGGKYGMDESRESIDSVGWEMQPSESGENVPPRFASPPGVTVDPFSSVETITPSQAQRAKHEVDPSSGALPSPPFPESSTPTRPKHFLDPPETSFYGHGPEATDATYATYRTASEGHSRGGTDVSDAERRSSVPPHTSAYTSHESLR